MGDGENDTFMDLQNFRDEENRLGSLVGGQPYDLDFGLRMKFKSCCSRVNQ